MLSPVWHEWVDGGFSIVIGADDVKSRQLQRDPRISVLVAQQEPPYASIELRGSAVLSRPPWAVSAVSWPGSMGGLTIRRWVHGIDARRARPATWFGRCASLKACAFRAP